MEALRGKFKNKHFGESIFSVKMVLSVGRKNVLPVSFLKVPYIIFICETTTCLPCENNYFWQDYTLGYLYVLLCQNKYLFVRIIILVCVVVISGKNTNAFYLI